MLFVLIPPAWLAVLTVLVAACRAAADGDAARTSGKALPSGPIGERVILSQTLPAPARQARRPHAHGPRLQSGRRTPRRTRLAAHGTR